MSINLDELDRESLIRYYEGELEIVRGAYKRESDHAWKNFLELMRWRTIGQIAIALLIFFVPISLIILHQVDQRSDAFEEEVTELSARLIDDY